MVKNPPVSAGDAVSIPDWGRFPEENSNELVAWEIPWTEEPGGLQFMRSQRVSQNCSVATKHTHTQICVTIISVEVINICIIPQKLNHVTSL